MIIDFANYQDGRRRDEGAVPTGNPIQTSASRIFRIRDDLLAEHWQVLDTCRVLLALGAIPRAANAFQQILGVEQSPGGLFQERPGTEFGRPGHTTRDP